MIAIVILGCLIMLLFAWFLDISRKKRLRNLHPSKETKVDHILHVYSKENDKDV